jgi:hypothetical protein
MRRGWAALSLVMLAGCARQTSIAPTTQASGNVGVGYVRMDVLLKAHPLYPDLVRLDNDVAALELRVAGAASRRSDTQIAQEERVMRRDLRSAQERTQKELAEKQSAYILRENTAIAEILAQGGVSAQSANAIEGQIAQASREQGKNIDQYARKNLQEYRLKMIAQSDAALSSVRESLLDRANRAYRMRSDAYVQNEAAFMLEQARRDAIERLLLRARLADLALDKPTRAQIQARLNAIGKQESDELGALHDRDHAALSIYQRQLNDDREAQENREAQEMRARTNAKLSDSATQTQLHVLGQVGAITEPPRLPGTAAEVLLPVLRDKLSTLHTHYQKTYAEDAERSVQQYAKTATELSARFDRLGGIDASAQDGAQKEIEGLRKQRDDLYGQMIAQIDREVKIVAGRGGIRNIVAKVANAGDGVDLTHEAAKNIESLHE